jgi:hypothetical protein
MDKSAAPAPEAAAVEGERVEIVAVEATATAGEKGKRVSAPFPNEISGIVVSAEDHAPVTGAYLLVNGRDAISVSDLEGRFSIPVSTDTQTLVSARYQGMEDKKITVSTDIPVTIMLQPVALPDREKSLYAVKEITEADDPGRGGLQSRSPEPSGGYISFYRYIEEHRRTPSIENEGTGGIVILQFTVSMSGELKDIVAVRSPGEPFTEEAIRLLKEGPPWIPAFGETGTIDQEVILRIELE